MARKTLKDAKFAIGDEVQVNGRTASVVGRAVMTSNKIVYTLQLVDFVKDNEVIGSYSEEFVADESELGTEDSAEKDADIKVGDRVRVTYTTGLHALGEGTVTDVDGKMISVDLGDEGEICFLSGNLEVTESSPATERVRFELHGPEDDTSTEDMWTPEEVAVLVKLAKKLNEDQRFSLQPYCEVTVNGETVIEWKEF